MNGKYVQIGRYPQTAEGGILPIDWQIIGQKDDRILLLARYVLDSQPFHTANQVVRWEDCSLRVWLNGEFLHTAFQKQELKMLADPAEDDGDFGRMLWEQCGAETVTEQIADRIFLLSRADISRFFPPKEGIPDDERMLFCPGASTEASEYVRNKMSDTQDCWWLRSSMHSGVDFPPATNVCIAWIVSPCNSIGISVIDGSNLQGVRPAIWVYVDRLDLSFRENYSKIPIIAPSSEE